MKEQMIKDYLKQDRKTSLIDLQFADIYDIQIKHSILYYTIKRLDNDEEREYIHLLNFLEWLYIRGNKQSVFSL